MSGEYWRVQIESTVLDQVWGLSDCRDDTERVELLNEDIIAILDGALWSIEEIDACPYCGDPRFPETEGPHCGEESDATDE